MQNPTGSCAGLPFIVLQPVAEVKWSAPGEEGMQTRNYGSCFNGIQSTALVATGRSSLGCIRANAARRGNGRIIVPAAVRVQIRPLRQAASPAGKKTLNTCMGASTLCPVFCLYAYLYALSVRAFQRASMSNDVSRVYWCSACFYHSAAVRQHTHPRTCIPASHTHTLTCRGA